MALKDLAIDRDAMTEATIEEIVSGLAGFDLSLREVILTPTGAALSSRDKVLVFLVARLGWRFVVDDPPPISMRPAELQAELGIAGGTLRPMLRELAESRLLRADNGSYSAEVANLSAIKLAIQPSASSGEDNPSKVRIARKRSRGPKRAKSESQKPEKTKAKRTGTGAGSQLRLLLDEGRLDEWTTIGQMVEMLHQRGIIVPMTSVSGPVLDLVRKRVLERDKNTGDGKSKWKYRRPSSSTGA